MAAQQPQQPKMSSEQTEKEGIRRQRKGITIIITLKAITEVIITLAIVLYLVIIETITITLETAGTICGSADNIVIILSYHPLIKCNVYIHNHPITQKFAQALITGSWWWCNFVSCKNLDCRGAILGRLWQLISLMQNVHTCMRMNVCGRLLLAKETR